MVFQNISTIFGSYTALILIVIFIAFVFAVRRVLRVIFHAIWVAFVSALFPLFSNAILDTTFPIELETFIFFITLGLGLYCVWILAKFVYFLTGIAEKMLSGVTWPFRAAKKGHEDKKKKEMEKFYEQMKKQKQNKKQEKKPWQKEEEEEE